MSWFIVSGLSCSWCSNDSSSLDYCYWGALYLFFPCLSFSSWPQISTWMTPSLPVGLYSEVTFSMKVPVGPQTNISVNQTIHIFSPWLKFFPLFLTIYNVIYFTYLFYLLFFSSYENINSMRAGCFVLFCFVQC